MPWIFLIPVFAALISAPAHAALPSDCVQSNYPTRVIPACTEILSQDPHNVIAYFKRGKAYLDYRTDTRDLPLAIADLTKAIEIDAKYANAYNLRGIALRRNGDLARAIADQSTAIEINPAFASAYNSRGFVYRQQRDYDRALRDYNKAIELDPGYALAYLNRAFTQDIKDDPNRAIADLKQAIKLGGREFDYVFFSLEPTEHNHVATLLTKAIERDARDAVAYYIRGLTSAAIDEQERAIADYNKAIELDPVYIDAYVARGRAYSSERYDDARALADYSKAIELDPKNARAYRARGSFYLDQVSDHGDRALPDYNKAIELDPGDSEAYLQRGLLYALNDQHALAKADFAKVLDIEWRLSAAITALYPNYVDEIEAERQTKPQ